jgi:hypothetical protein
MWDQIPDRPSPVRRSRLEGGGTRSRPNRQQALIVRSDDEGTNEVTGEEDKMQQVSVLKE